MSYSTPSELKYAKTHEWVKVDGDIATIGIDDYAQAALGELVYVELPAVGKEFAAGADLAVVESFKTASDVYAPISGTVVEVNEAAVSAPDTVNQSPYGDGWLVKLRISNPGELDALLSAEKYAETIKE
jgi:glycine cleavage system H protein